MEAAEAVEDAVIKEAKAAFDAAALVASRASISTFLDLSSLTSVELVLTLNYLAYLTSSSMSAVESLKKAGDARYPHVYAVEGCETRGPPEGVEWGEKHTEVR